jgi:hypothetical protein
MDIAASAVKSTFTFQRKRSYRLGKQQGNDLRPFSTDKTEANLLLRKAARTGMVCNPGTNLKELFLLPIRVLFL